MLLNGEATCHEFKQKYVHISFYFHFRNNFTKDFQRKISKINLLSMIFHNLFDLKYLLKLNIIYIIIL